jgi:hypothetical protein
MLRSDSQFWRSRPDLREPLMAITERALTVSPTMQDIDGERFNKEVTRVYDEFRKRQAAAV